MSISLIFTKNIFNREYIELTSRPYNQVSGTIRMYVHETDGITVFQLSKFLDLINYISVS